MATLLDAFMASLSVTTPKPRMSRMVKRPMVRRPSPVSIRVSGRTSPRSSASAATIGLTVEPGSKVSVRARLRTCSPLRLRRWLGLKLG